MPPSLSPPSSASSSSSSSASSTRSSRFSFLTPSSSSTFSDISVAPPPSASKTHAFFASPFTARPPSPPHLPAGLPSIAFDADDAPTEPTPRPKDHQPSFTFFQPPLESDDPQGLHSGTLISAGAKDDALRLLTPLGHGAFSSVWLAEDRSTIPLVLRSRRSLRSLRRHSSTSSNSSPPPSRANSLRKLRNRLQGTCPLYTLETNLNVQSSLPVAPSLSRPSSHSSLSEFIHDHDATSFPRGRLVAVKMTLRSSAAPGDPINERERVAFVREVEVLKHIAHPSITPLLTSFSTPTHHILVLPYLPGGDLLALINSDVSYSRLRESVVQRIWVELIAAIAWMHGVGLVHRDVKLENILLTTPAFISLTADSPAPMLADFPPAPAPLIKLTDFGLSRFIDVWSSEGEDESNAKGDRGPLLSTRCGSEAYAAPELVIGGGGSGGGTSASRQGSFLSTRRGERPPGMYDPRETDAWACGVVLYTLCVRRLPFGEGVSVEAGSTGAGRMKRRAWLMRIAKGEWEWPGAVEQEGKEGEELMGERLVESRGARRVVSRLLVRDPRKRARVGELWGDEWMGGAGGEVNFEDERYDVEGGGGGGGEEEVELSLEDELTLLEEGNELVDEDEGGGILVDQDGIGEIARQEVV